VGYASVNRWLRLFRETDQLAPKPLPGRTPRIDEAGQALVRRLVSERPDSTVTELAEAFGSVVGARLAPCIMHRALVKLGLSRKKRQCMLRSASETTSHSFDGTTSDFAAVSSAFDAASSSSTKAE
jgi:transposase